MSAPDILTVARWLQDRHGLYVFAVDHPGRPECGGSHRECDGQRGKHPRGQWSRLATLSPRLIRAQLADGPWNIGIACKQSLPARGRRGPAGRVRRVRGVHRPGDRADVHCRHRQGAPLLLPAGREGAPLGNGRGGWPGTASTSAAAAPATAGTSSAPAVVHQTGVVYTPVDSAMPIQPVPGWLAEVLRPAQPPEPARSARRPASTFGALRGLVRVVLDATPERDRNTRLFWSACRAAELVSAGAGRRGDRDQACSSTPRRAPACPRRRHGAPSHPGCAPGRRARRQAARDGEAGRDENPAADEGRAPPRARTGPVRAAQGHQVAVPDARRRAIQVRGTRTAQAARRPAGSLARALPGRGPPVRAGP